MAQELSQQQQQRLVQRLTPMQVRYVRLLEMNRQEAEDAVDRELEANPALEVEERSEDNGSINAGGMQIADPQSSIPYYRMSVSNRSDDDGPSARDLALMTAAQAETLYDHLRRQLDEHPMPADVRMAADYIIGELDSNGYLRRTPAAMIDDLAFSTGQFIESDVMEEALRQVRLLEPAGVGASGLQQALAMQLGTMPRNDARDNALRIIEEAFDELTMHHPHRIISRLKLSQQDYEDALRIILSLNPRPGASYGSGDADRAGAVVPDFAVDEDSSGKLSVSIPSRISELAIESGFATALSDMERNAASRREQKVKLAKEGNMAFTMQLYRDARDFVDIWKQRRTTLMAVMTAIVKIQERYFRTSDDADLRPMALKDIAELTGYDLSTISRATGGKYVQTSWGIIPLRHLFSERMGNAGEASGVGSARGIQAALRTMVEGEDKRHPLSDETLMQRLTAAGFDVKRRTVAKYRELLGIPSSRLRRKL